MKTIFLVVLSTVLLLKEINAHGRLVVPPARSTAWRENPSLFPAYYNDMEMFCGGKSTQWNQNGGKCSICGENYAKEKRFEKGGDLYRGHIVRSYAKNSKIEVDVELTTNHRGWFEFRLCNIDNMNEATQECLDRTLLKDASGKSRFDSPSQVEGWQGHFKHSLIIPTNFECNHCVFQWKYNVGNSHGNDFVTGEYCLGCGPQEQFYGCSDISITNGGGGIVVPPPTQPSLNIVPIWGQCGGEGYTGSTNCGTGNVCTYQSQWYSQCTPKK
jgi:hypothetical protein